MSPNAVTDRVVVLNDDSRVRGGAAQLALRQVALLADRGVPVTFVAGDAGNAGDAPELGREGVVRVSIGASRLRDLSRARAAVQGLWHRDAARAVAALIERTDTPGSVYHLHNWQTILSPATVAALRPVASRTWLHAHDYFLCCPNGAFHDYVKRRPCPLVPLSARCVATDCDKVSRAEKGWRVVRQAALLRAVGDPRAFAGVMLIHAAMAEPFERSGWPSRRLHVVPNPAPPPPPGRVVAEANDTFVFMGRVEREKGVEALLAAADTAGIAVEVAGDGALFHALAARHPRARMHGWLDRTALAALLARARFLVMPTLLPEPFGLVLVEALQAGVPVIVSRSAALAGEIVAAGAGIACDPHQAERLAGQLRAARALDAAAVRRMSEAARALAPRLASTEARWVDRMLALYGAARHESRG